MAATVARIVHVPYVVRQNEDGAWCASAQLRPGVGAADEGLTRQAAIAALKAGVGLLIEETGVPEELIITSLAPSEADPPLPPRRIDYYDDPGRPRGQQPRPVGQRRRDQPLRRHPDDPAHRQRQLGRPGGAIDLGESVAQAAVRETREETGIECEVTGITGIYFDPRHIILYTSNGEVRQEFSIVLTARPRSGQPTPSSESSEVRWVPAAEVAGYTMDWSMRIRINDYLARKGAPVIG